MRRRGRAAALESSRATAARSSLAPRRRVVLEWAAAWAAGKGDWHCGVMFLHRRRPCDQMLRHMPSHLWVGDERHCLRDTGGGDQWRRGAGGGRCPAGAGWWGTGCRGSADSRGCRASWWNFVGAGGAVLCDRPRSAPGAHRTSNGGDRAASCAVIPATSQRGSRMVVVWTDSDAAVGARGGILSKAEKTRATGRK